MQNKVIVFEKEIFPLQFKGAGKEVKNKLETQDYKSKLISQTDFNFYIPLKSEFNVCQKHKISNFEKKVDFVLWSQAFYKGGKSS